MEGTGVWIDEGDEVNEAMKDMCPDCGAIGQGNHLDGCPHHRAITTDSLPNNDQQNDTQEG